jgi:hypothetical protein
MSDPRNPALKAGPTLPAALSVDRAALLARKKSDRAFLSSSELHVDRVALLRYAVVLFALTVLYLVVGPSKDEHEWGVVNLIGPISLCMAGLWAGYRIVTTNPRTIWTPIPWFALTSSLYYGLGPLLYLFGSAEVIDSLNDYWPVDPSDLWRANLLSTVCLLTIAGTFLATDRLLETGRDSERIASTVAGDDDPAQRALFLFLGFGIPLRYLLVLPCTFGQLPFVVPGSLFVLGCLVKLAVFMLAYLGAKRQGLWRAGFWMLFGTELITNFLCLSKLEVLLVFIMAALGRFLAKKKVKELVFAGVVTLGIFIIIAPLVTWSRLRISRETGNASVAPFELRLAVTAEALELWLKGELEIEGDTNDRGWGRLCYTPTQTACLHLYDSGFAGDSFAYALYSWIPRFIWSDKPTMSLGQDFTLMVKGRIGTCTAAGFFAEAYWNGGWLLVVLTCVYVGVLFAWLSRAALRIIAHSEWVFLPCAFIGMSMGLRLDDWFAPTFVTGFLMYLVYYFIIRLVTGFAQTRD